jgi:sorbitol/mannitol transport system permease protein
MTYRLREYALTALTYIAVLAIFFPILWTLLAGFKTEATAVAQPPVLFFVPTLDNFREALTNAGYVGFFVNSVIISVGSTLVAFVFGIPAAYALGLFPTAKSAGTLSWVLSTKMMPVVGVIIPLIIIFKQIGLFDTIPGMILLYTAINLPLVIWMMRSFFAEIPKDLIEAARIDGANTVGVLVGVAIPFVTPGLAATALLCLIFSWNEFFLVVNLAGPHASTLPVYIAGFMTSEGLFWAKMSAASTLAVIPVFIAGWAAQRSLVRGLTMGAVK